MATAPTAPSSSLFLLTTPLHLRPRIRIPTHPFFLRFPTPFQIRVLGFSKKGARSRLDSVCSVSRGKEGRDATVVEEETSRPRFDINLAVILAGFAFEAYYTPPDSIGRLEMDGAGCKTAYLSKSFVREIYDGQLFVNLKKGFDFPALDLWGTSDPYVVMQLGGQVCKSKVKWATIAPTWNEEFTFNTKQRPEESLQVAAWDANLVTPHKRLGNSAVNLVDLCDGNLHELLVELEGMGGGGKIQLEVKYKSFDEIDKEKEWWRVVPFVSEFLRRSGFESALQKLVGSETVQASQFVQYAFSQFKSLNDMYLQKELSPANSNNYLADKGGSGESDTKQSSWPQNDHPEGFSGTGSNERGDNIKLLEPDRSNYGAEVGKTTQSNMHFWKNFADVISQSVVQKLGMPVPEKMKWDGFELLNKIGLQMGRVAEAGYIESGLATPSTQEADDKKEPETSPLGMEKIYSSLPDIKRAAEDLLTQTDSLFGGLMVMAAAVPQLRKEANDVEATEIQEGGSSKPDDVMLDLVKSDQIEDLDEKKAEEMKILFSTAESAMEAWAMLASSLGHPSFIKSEFEKLCFLDNSSTDTQVAIWRDSRRKRLVVAFRGTEQVRWKDLRTDLMLAPAGLNPERLGGNFKEEVQVHSGFLTAYDSVRTKIMSLIQQAVACRGDGAGTLPKWNVYVTGHSLGGALATLLALELSSSHLAKSGAISVAMYNFGSPRVGNRRFAVVYNEKVKDSWRVVNQRDIIPTVPRLMGYCHVAQPVYLTAGVLRRTYENPEPLIDGYNGDVIGESTPDRLVSEFMRGEKEFIEKILQTEINIFRSIRDGTGLMQHMEDFYYISLLEKVSNYQIDSAPQNEGDGFPVG